jgi:hypothetical protein
MTKTKRSPALRGKRAGTPARTKPPRNSALAKPPRASTNSPPQRSRRGKSPRARPSQPRVTPAQVAMALVAVVALGALAHHTGIPFDHVAAALVSVLGALYRG